VDSKSLTWLLVSLVLSVFSVIQYPSCGHDIPMFPSLSRPLLVVIRHGGAFCFPCTALSLALAPELLLLLFSDLLVDLGSLARLVAVCASGQGSVLLSALLIEGDLLALVLTLLLTRQLVLDGALVLYGNVRLVLRC
jgi:hypothetical protein